MAKTTGNFQLIAVLAAAATLAGASGAAAQSDSVPPLPEGSGFRAAADAISGSGARETIDTPGGSAPSNSYSYDPVADEYALWEGTPAAVETSGTWLDRGYWYSQVEAVVMVRRWSSERFLLAGDGVPLSGGAPVTTFPGPPITGFSTSNRSLSLGRSTPGREGSARLTLGRFLFRDGANRDHNLEFTVLGGGEFGENTTLFADNPDDPLDLDDDALLPGIVVVTDLTQNADVTFSGAESSTIQYDSRLNSFELNYTMKTRLAGDQVTLLPSGQWVRRANSGLTYNFLAGLRYLDLTENVDWVANNIDNPNITTPIFGDRGQYLIRTSNDNFGVQAGIGAAYRNGRFSIESLGKVAILANDAKSRAGLTFTDPDTDTVRDDISFSNSNRTDTLAFLSEYSMVGRYHLTPNISWRAGYHLLYLTNVALAPHQIDFAPDNAAIATTGDIFYHGLSLGFDVTW